MDDNVDGADFLASYPMGEADRRKVGYENALRLFGYRIPNIGGGISPASAPANSD
jgi:2,3-dihydroxybenzoate decarboxylase